MSEEESRPQFDFLLNHRIRSEFTCRFPLDTELPRVLDNRCVQHYPLNDYRGVSAPGTALSTRIDEGALERVSSKDSGVEPGGQQGFDLGE